MVPEPGTTCLGHGVLLLRGRWPVGRAATQDLIALATRELGELGLADPDEGRRRRRSSACRRRIRSTTRRTARTSTSCGRYIDPIPNLHTVGRNGMHKYNNQDHSMLTAMMAVANMRGRIARRLGGQHRLRVSRGAEARSAPSQRQWREATVRRNADRRPTPCALAAAARTRATWARDARACASASTRPAGRTHADTAGSPASCCARSSRRAAARVRLLRGPPVADASTCRRRTSGGSSAARASPTPRRRPTATARRATCCA